MDIGETKASTAELVAAVSSELTPAERRIAREVLDEPTLLAFGTVTDLARRVGTSRPTIVRFANKLGFEGYTQLQRQARIDLSHQLSRPSERIRHDDSARPARAAIDSAIDSVFDASGEERLEAMVRSIANADRVWVLSGETSRAGAHALQSRLSIIRPRVRWLEEHSLATALSDAQHGDVAVVFDFYRYRRQALAAARSCVDSGVKVLAVTDGPLSPLAELAEHWVDIEVPAVGPFDSSVPAVAMAELLVSKVAKELQEEATVRIDRIEALWEETKVFV